ncbi:peptidylprolyl isomerase [Leminorella grimontii]|uniref:peptidylprolyl isomerase n=1 Tax=Leminorella grimontii TaxID=82981 RepID=UPI003220855D
MMDNLRAASNSVVLKVILAAIMLSFILTGVGGYLTGGSANYAAEVNGQEINSANFEQSFNNERNRLQQQLGDNFSQLMGNDAYIKQLRQDVLNRMINDLLIDQYAAKLGMAIGDDQVKLSIQNSPEFFTDGKFDNAKYRDLLNRINLAPEQYAEIVRKQLLSQQVVRAFAGSDFALPVEAESTAALIQQKRDVRLAPINTAALAEKKEAMPSDEQVKAFYEQNKTRFTTPESVKVSYIEVDAASLGDGLTVSEQEIADFYQKNKPMYIQKPRFNYSVIVLDKEGDAKAVLEQLKQGGDFAALAKEKSIDKDSGAKGGDLGWLESTAIPDDILAAKLTEKGQLSGVIHSDLGYLVVRLNGSEEAKEKPLADVKKEITQALLQDKSYEKYEDLQTKMLDATANDKFSLDGAAKAAGLKVVETDWFTRDDVPQALNYPEVTQAVFGGELFGAKGAPGANSDLITVEGDRAFMLRIAEHRPEAVKKFEDVAADITALLKRQNITEMARKQAQELVTALQAGKGDEALAAAGVKFGDKQEVTRFSDDAQISDSVFALPLPKDGKPAFGVASDMKGNVVLVALDAVAPGKLEDKQAQAVTAQLAQQNGSMALDALINSLRAQAKIKIGEAAGVK